MTLQQKLQTGVVTEKVIEQLNAEPKVVISVNSALRDSVSKSDRNVPDLCHEANNVECCTAVEDTSVYNDKHNQNVSEKSKNGDDSAINDIESELDKMFCLDNELSTIHQETSKAPLKQPRNKNRRVQKEDLNQLLIKLFGSPLEDLESKKYQPKKIHTARRHTLPVSINVPQEFLKPLKVSQKRRSANDAISTLCKAQKTVSKPTVCELPEPEVAKLLVKGEKIERRVNAVLVSELEVATVMDRPTTGVAETVENDLVIDLTGEDEDSDSDELVIDTSSEEVKEEPSASSERASVPTQAPSMPLLSPVSPAQATQREATLPETSSNTFASSQRPPPHIPVMVAPKPPAPRPRVATKRPYQDFGTDSQQVPARSQLASVRLPPKRPNQSVLPEPPLRPSNQDAVLQVISAASQLSLRPSNQDTVPLVSAASQLSLRPSNQEVVPQDARSQHLVPTGLFLPEGPSPAQDSVAANVAQSVAGGPNSAVAELNQQVPAAPPAPVSSVRAEQRQQEVPSPQGQAPPLPTHSYFSNLRMLQSDKTSRQAPNRRHSVEQFATASNVPQIAMHQSNLSQQRPPDVQLQATVSSILQTAQHQASILPQQPQMVCRPQAPPYPGLQRQPAEIGASRAPPLIRMFRPTRTQYEFHLISNAACGEKILPHVLMMARWKASAIRFCDEVQTYLSPNDFKQDYGGFCLYIAKSLTNFGKNLIRDLSSVEVENFDLGEVCTVISRQLQEQNCSATIYRVCVNIHAMIKSCEEFCLSPFTKRFFHTVKTCVGKMEEKSQKGQQAASFTVSQLKQLELQIQQFIHIQRWLDFTYSSSNRPQPRPHHRTTIKKTQKKATDTNPNTLMQNLQLTMLRTMLQHVPDRPGRSNDNPIRPDLTPVIADKQVVPTEQTPVISSVEKSPSLPHPVPVRVLLPQPPPLPAEVPAIARESPSREASVIVFKPIEEAPPVVEENRTKMEQRGQDEDIIDLTWIDDGDENLMLEEIAESKAFTCKLENYPESEPGGREVISPADSGLGSPHSQTDESFKCLCGKQAIYVCACNSSMYCGRECQINDWADHQRWCQGQENSS